jgi:hypothetical protein
VDHLVEHRQRRHDLAGLDLGDHALVASDGLRQVPHAQSLGQPGTPEARTNAQIVVFGTHATFPEIDRGMYAQ